MRDKPFCILPWYHQMIQPDGSMIPCCAWTSEPDETLPGFEDFFRSQFMDDLRQRMLAHDPPRQCRICVQKDAIKNDSVRVLGWEIAKQLGMDHRQGPVLLSQDVNFSNLCNIKCRTCSSVLSTKWIADEQRLHMVPMGGGRHTKTGWRMTSDDAGTIRKLEFTGGEPLLHQGDIIHALGMIAERDRLGEVIIDITTNGMVEPGDELMDLLRRARRLYLNVSVDGEGRLNEYIRSDSDWDTMQRVVGRFDSVLGRLPNVYMMASTVYSVLNSNAMEGIWKWLRTWAWQGNTNGLIICYGPEIYDARILPSDYKRTLIDRYLGMRGMYPEREHMINGITSHLSQELEGSALLLRKLRDRNAALDAIRGADLRSCNPELADVLGF